MLFIPFDVNYLPIFLTRPILHFLPKIIFLFLFICLMMFFIVTTKKTSSNVYLIDFACYKPPTSQRCSKENVLNLINRNGHFSNEMVDFMKKAFERCGLGDSTYLSETFFEQRRYKPLLKDSTREVEMAIFGSVDMLMAKTGVRCEDIGILIVNCCIYNALPSLSSIILNRYKLRDNTVTYNLAGMGCSAGLLAIILAKQLLQVHHNSYALIVSTESITENMYLGEDRSKHLTNFVFRVGGAAILLSNRPSDRQISKYHLLHEIHTNTSTSDPSYNSILREEDNAGIVGVTVNSGLLVAAIATIKPNVTKVGFLVLPTKEKLLYVVTYITRKLIPSMNIPLYVPNYSTSIHHFLPHVGGKPVLDDLQKTLGFSDETMEASRMTLYRFGNTSSSSIWYELAYVEAKRRVKKGDRVWQVAFGSGFKCNSVIWQAMKTVDEHDDLNPWTDEIDRFPITLTDHNPLVMYFEPSRPVN